MQTAFVTGADRGLGLSIVKLFAQKGWRVFAGSYLSDWLELGELVHTFPGQVTIVELDIASDQSVKHSVEHVGSLVDCVDVIVNNAGVSTHLKDSNIQGKQDYTDLLRLYNVNALGMLRVTKAYLPLTASSNLKRLCFVSSEAGSISACEWEAWYGYCMSKASMNMGVNLLFHTLRPQGYTFRLFHPGWMKSYMSGVRNEQAQLEPDVVAASAISYFIQPRCAVQNGVTDEDRLVMRDWRGREWPW
ncbi:SDR family NAD(P)-dependent oxidoreductase [Paenibacillus hexagrammi]|uniref:SDR family NAD(P)-dependent oxidoreductase n=1 Tax=Paenibacillus hexagrammi TaxID=2908839 RepID=A0ABY3SE90_9BACL|nr:SDR family NAD(P)-dependent oxidoreductase [Paenibacillus sp. YPD9-1]UJF31785.1 SDR family NAD(P)-dependent oxidoreductase [Paenibacillus sp. YPD9-1]